MATAKAWLKASRLRTLPLAFSSILMGGILAFELDSFRPEILGLSLLTTLFLQVLSNLANDLGDADHGVDDSSRVGPMRAIQSGEITAKEMKTGVIICAALALISGISLLYLSSLNTLNFIMLLSTGLFAIWAAYRYTAGENPYGYRAMGDLFVFLFFGLIGVLGSFYLHGSQIPNLQHLLPTVFIGFLSTSVLNLNNMRDAIPDAASGKITMAVKLGPKRAKGYHFTLVIVGFLSLLLYSILNFNHPLRFLFVLGAFILVPHLIRVHRVEAHKDLDPELKKVALSSLLITLLFGIGIVFF